MIIIIIIYLFFFLALIWFQKQTAEVHAGGLFSPQEISCIYDHTLSFMSGVACLPLVNNCIRKEHW